MNILVPIDFSNASVHAFQYAKEIALQLKAKLTALHIDSETDLSYKSLMQNELEERKKKLIRITRNYPNKNGLKLAGTAPLNRIVRVGRVVDEIIKCCEEEAIDLIVLGTRAKHYLGDYLFGSVSTKLIKQTSCPVLVIPEEAEIVAIRHIALATKLEGTSQSIIDYLYHFADRLEASMEQVSVYPIKIDIDESKEVVVDHFGGIEREHQKMTVVRDVFLQKGLDYFVEKHAVDLLALYVPEKNSWWEQLRRNYSKRLIYKTKVPLLIFNNTNIDEDLT